MRAPRPCERSRDGRGERLAAILGIVAEGGYALAFLGLGYLLCLALAAA